MNILIFKNDRVGDLLHHSCIINNIKQNFKLSKITLVCSRYNYSIAKNYKFIDELIVSDDQNIALFYFKNFKTFQKKFEFVFILDGKKSSILTSLFVKTNKRVTVCYKKTKNFFGLNYNIYRPSQLILKLFFKEFIYSDENYENTEILYQKIYLKLLEKCNIKIFDNKNLYLLQKDQQNDFENLKKKMNLDKKYCVFHLDEKMNQLNNDELENINTLIKNLSKKLKIVLTTGIYSFKYENYFDQKYKNYNYEDLLKNNLNVDENQIILKNMPIDLFAFFLNNSEINISFHAGPVVNISAALDKRIIDIMPKSKFNELGRWIPIKSNYKRYSFDNINDILTDIKST